MDAMLPYGFPEGRVKQCVKELLKVSSQLQCFPFQTFFVCKFPILCEFYGFLFVRKKSV